MHTCSIHMYTFYITRYTPSYTLCKLQCKLYNILQYTLNTLYTVTGIDDATALDLARKLEFAEDVVPEAAAQIKKLYELFVGVDATQVIYYKC